VIRRRRGIEVKTDAELVAMRRAGRVVADALAAMRSATRPGVTTADLDAVAREVLREAGATSSFLGYSQPPFPAVICASANEEVVHGIPGPRELVEGDLLSVDFGAIVAGWHGDAAITIEVGDVGQDRRSLSEVTRSALWAGLAAARPGGRLSDISHAVESAIRDRPAPRGTSWGIVQEYGGHGIGSQMHMEPHILNYGPPGRGPRLVPGMALAIEPMVIMGPPDVALAEDQWTVVSAVGAPSAHWEHTVAITEDGPWVLTAPDGGAEAFAALGVPSPAAERD
jgi:methionyl aminopeptidase